MSSPVAGHPEVPGLVIRRQVGSGGFADVFLCHDTSLGREVAVKVVKSDQLGDDDVAAFLGEAHAMARLAHPHIVPVYSVGRSTDGRPYLTMPYYPLGTLFEHARRPLGVPEVLQTGVQIGSAIAFAHDDGLLHRDVKPHNVLRNQFGPALSDFGIAATMAELEEGAAGISIPWSPPELLLDSAPASRASDIYSFAATLWQLLTSRAPFDRDGDSERDLVQRIVHEPLGPLERPDVPASLEHLLRRCLAKDPAERVASAGTFVRELQHVERQMQLPPTRMPTGSIETDDRGPATGSTRRKPPRTVNPPDPAPAPAAEPVPHETLHRAVEPVPAEPPAVEPARRVPVVLLLLVIAMFVVLLLGVVMLVFRPGGSGSSTGSSAPAQGVPRTAPDGQPAGRPA